MTNGRGVGCQLWQVPGQVPGPFVNQAPHGVFEVKAVPSIHSHLHPARVVFIANEGPADGPGSPFPVDAFLARPVLEHEALHARELPLQSREAGTPRTRRHP